MSVTDCFTYSGEVDMLELHLSILDPYVDHFVIGEAAITFSGRTKPLYFDEQYKEERFQRFVPKITYAIVDDFYHPSIMNYMLKTNWFEMAYPFKMSFYQKEHLQMGIATLGLKDTDTVYFGDCDEIWTPQTLQSEPHKLEQLMYSYHLNRRSTEKWNGTFISSYKDLKNKGINALRKDITKTLPNGGWHFTNMGGLEAVHKKLRDYDHQEINTPDIHENLERRFNEGEDFLGREHRMHIDESEWPPYLKDNRDKYAHLCL